MSGKRLAVMVLPLVLGCAALVALAARPGDSADAVRSAEARTTLPGSRYTDVFGKVVTLGATQPAAMAFVFINTECPISNKAVPELNRLAKLAADKHIEFYGVLSDPSVTRTDGQKHSRDYQIAFPVLFDASGMLAAALQPAVTPHAFIIDRHGKVLYSGRIDDAYIAVGNPRSVVTAHDLEEALAAAAAGRSHASTTPVGCVFESWKHPVGAAAGKVTWSRDIAPLVYANCAACHHEGEVAPFPLMKYEDAAKRSQMLAGVTESRQMPPWKADDAWGTFHDERRLTAEQIALFRAWADAGAPEGAAVDAPPAPVFTDDWKLGTPDLVVKMARSIAVPAGGRDIMAYSVIPLNLAADEYVVGFEYRPGNRKVVHHMIALLDASGAARQIARDKGDGSSYINFGGPGFLPTGGVGGWAPGATPRLLPDGVGHPLRRGSDLVLQVHYHPSGKPESDQGELALYFAKKPIRQTSISVPLRNRDINIPAGDSNYVRTAQITVPVDVTLFGITPHMHNLGREMKVVATLPDGRKVPLITVSDWDWNWQDQYQYAQPIKLPRGTRVDLWARYDNSKDNPRNPQNPPQVVTFGEQTTNEMCIAFLQVTIDGVGGAGRAGPLRSLIEQLRGGRSGN